MYSCDSRPLDRRESVVERQTEVLGCLRDPESNESPFFLITEHRTEGGSDVPPCLPPDDPDTLRPVSHRCGVDYRMRTTLTGLAIPSSATRSHRSV